MKRKITVENFQLYDISKNDVNQIMISINLMSCLILWIGFSTVVIFFVTNAVYWHFSLKSSKIQEIVECFFENNLI